MKVLTIHQPYATLIVLALKLFETRTWTTPHRGPLLIHASSKVYDPLKDHLDGYANTIEEWLKTWGHYGGDIQFPTRAIIGAVNVTDIYPHSKIAANPELVSPLDRRFGFFAPGWCAWKLEDAVALDHPIPAAGQQGLWEYPIDPKILQNSARKKKISYHWQLSA